VTVLSTTAAAAEELHYVPASGTLSAVWLLLALPAAGAVILYLSGKRAEKWGPVLACAMAGLAFVWGLISFFALKGEESRQVTKHLFSWVPVGSFQVDAGLLFDPLSATFVLLITGVGFLIHVYSLGYMEHDERKVTFFAHLNLFVAAMLLLVLGNSFLALYVGWEGVGLASYLLIAFWYFKPDAATAAKKAMIWPSSVPFSRLKATRVRLTELSISSMHMNTRIALRRSSTPTAPMVKSRAARNR
jgi:NADH-quinone oxidoreductase subunit L